MCNKYMCIVCTKKFKAQELEVQENGVLMCDKCVEEGNDGHR